MAYVNGALSISDLSFTPIAALVVSQPPMSEVVCFIGIKGPLNYVQTLDDCYCSFTFGTNSISVNSHNSNGRVTGAADTSIVALGY